MLDIKAECKFDRRETPFIYSLMYLVYMFTVASTQILLLGEKFFSQTIIICIETESFQFRN